MSTDLAEALDEVRDLLLDDESLVRAVGAGRRRSAHPRWRRVELRYVDLRAGRRLQVTALDATQAHASNHEPGGPAQAAIDDLLQEPFGNWHVETTTGTVQVRVTKKGAALVHRSRRDPTRAEVQGPDRSHDRVKERLLPAQDPLFAALGITDAQGRVKPTRERKYRQVEEFLRALGPTVDAVLAAGRTPTEEDPLRVVDLGCGNGYLTFAAHRYLAAHRSLPVRVVGVDVKEQSREHNTAVAEQLDVSGAVSFVVGTIGAVSLEAAPDVVLALHACDTATDEALARAVGWASAAVLAAPCCHHDLAAQLRRAEVPEPYAALTRHGILRERLADTLTDGLRAAILRREGYRVDVIEFVESRHTPRNTLLRAVRTGVRSEQAATEVDELTRAWTVTPALETMLSGIGPADRP